ncbi:MAG: hypothetical protein ACRD12_14670 [Acidimicrobiales bacterium]
MPEVLIMLSVLAGGIAGGLVLLRVTVAAPPVQPPLWEVVPVGIEAGEETIELHVAAAVAGTMRTIRLVGDRPPVGVVSAVEGWCTSSTPVLLRMDAGDGASLHGPDASLVGLMPSRSDASDDLPCNTVDYGGRSFLRVTSPHDRVLHLVPRTTAPGRPAVGARPDPAWDDYDAAALLRPCWTPRTMCGFEWRTMAAHRQELAALTAALRTKALRRGDYVCPACAWFAAAA